MNKSTLIFVSLSVAVLGSLVGLQTATSEEQSKSVLPTTSFNSGGLTTFRYLSPEGIEVKKDEFGDPLPNALGENFVTGHGDWRHEKLEIKIGGDASVEYKALMIQGGSLNFRWSVEGGTAYYDMHGHDSSFGKEFFTRYDEGESTYGSGTIVAAYGGQHGWYWLNLESEPITIHLEVTGFYKKIVEIDLSNE